MYTATKAVRLATVNGTIHQRTARTTRRYSSRTEPARSECRTRPMLKAMSSKKAMANRASTTMPPGW